MSSSIIEEVASGDVWSSGKSISVDSSARAASQEELPSISETRGEHVSSSVDNVMSNLSWYMNDLISSTLVSSSDWDLSVDNSAIWGDDHLLAGLGWCSGGSVSSTSCHGSSSTSSDVSTRLESKGSSLGNWNLIHLDSLSDSSGLSSLLSDV